MGKCSLHGAKNAAMPILAATVLTDEEVELRNVPVELNDFQVMLEILQSLRNIWIQEIVAIHLSVNTSRGVNLLNIIRYLGVDVAVIDDERMGQIT